MTDTTSETTRALLESALNQTSDAEIRFKLRTALQLLVIMEEQHDIAREALADVKIEEDVREDLRELGYLD